MRVVAIVAIHNKLVAIVTIESIVGGDSDKPTASLHYRIHMIVRKPFRRSEMEESMRVLRIRGLSKEKTVKSEGYNPLHKKDFSYPR